MLSDDRKRLLIAEELFRLMLYGAFSDEEHVQYLDKLASKLNEVFFDYEPVAKRQLFDVKHYNENLEALQLDLNFLYDRILSLMKQLIARYNQACVEWTQYKQYLKRIKAQLQLLSIAVSDLEDSFLIAFDDFSDLSKTDLTVSTAGVVDLNENCLALPYNEKGRKRYFVRVGHSDLDVTYPTREFKTQEAAPPVNAFDDSAAAWLWEVTGSSKGTVVTTLEFALDPHNLAEVPINQIAILPIMPGRTYYSVLHSLDKENWHYFEGAQNVEGREGAAEIVIDCPLTYARYIRFEVAKTEPTIVRGEQKLLVWQFGIKELKFYTTGRVSHAIYQSKPLNLGVTPELLTLDADAKVPAGTSLAFSVALAKNGTKVTDFIPVKPGSLEKPSTAPIYFTRANEREKTFLSSGASHYLTWHGIEFWKLGTLDETPIFGRARLYRGFQGWTRVTKGRGRNKEVNNIFVSFASSDVQPIYAPTTEVPTVKVDSTNRTAELSLRHPVAKGQGWTLVPPSEVGKAKKPMYSIVEVLQYYQAATRSVDITYPQYDPTKGPPPKIDLTKITPRIPLHFIVSGDNKPILERVDAGFEQTYLAGIDYIIDVKDVAGRLMPIGTITIPEGSELAAAAERQAVSLRFTYTLDQDITHKVSSVSGNIVTLKDIDVGNGDTFTITYHYVPLPPNGIVGTTLRVKPDMISGPEDDFILGKDYRVDLEKGLIERIDGGRILKSGGVYLDFTIQHVSEGVEQFYTWVYQPHDRPLRVNLLQPLEPDVRVKEGFFLLRGDAMIDLTLAKDWVDLPKGWHQFVVFSKTPEQGRCLLYQVQQLATREGQFIFKHRGRIFSVMTAERVPRRQVTWNRLKRGTLKANHDCFAITDDNEVIINYEPGTAGEIYYLEPSNTGRPATPSVLEYQVTYACSTDTMSRGDQVIVRCELFGATEHAQSPKVFKYWVKAR